MKNKIYTYLCPAKVNLFLYVLGRRPDGYHNIYTLFYPVSIYDTLSIQKADITTLTCSNKNIPENADNIIIKKKNIICMIIFILHLKKIFHLVQGLAAEAPMQHII